MSHADELLSLLIGGSPGPTHERVAVALRRAVTLRIFPDDRLPSERQLAETLGVSRVTVREALRALREDGLILSGGSRHSGTVSVPRRLEAHASWQSLLADARSDIADILEFRSIVEPTAARLAAHRVNDDMATRLDATLEVMRAGPDASAFRRADSEFHTVIARASGNRRLTEAVLVTRAELLHWRDLLPMADHIEENVRDHGLIMTAIVAGDPDGAAREMANHLRTTLESFVVKVGELSYDNRISSADPSSTASTRRPAV